MGPCDMLSGIVMTMLRFAALQEEGALSALVKECLILSMLTLHVGPMTQLAVLAQKNCTSMTSKKTSADNWRCCIQAFPSE